MVSLFKVFTSIDPPDQPVASPRQRARLSADNNQLCDTATLLTSRGSRRPQITFENKLCTHLWCHCSKCSKIVVICRGEFRWSDLSLWVYMDASSRQRCVQLMSQFPITVSSYREFNVLDNLVPLLAKSNDASSICLTSLNGYSRRTWFFWLHVSWGARDLLTERDTQWPAIRLGLVCSTPLLAPRIGLYTASVVLLKDALIGWRASDYDAPIQLWRIQINTGYTLPSPTWSASPTWRKKTVSSSGDCCTVGILKKQGIPWIFQRPRTVLCSPTWDVKQSRLGLFDGWQSIFKCEMKVKPRLLLHIFHDTLLGTPHGNIIEIQQKYVFFFVIYWNKRRGAQKYTKF